MTRITTIIPAAALLLALMPNTPAAAFGMGGAPGVAVATPMGGPAMTANGGNAAFAHGSPAGSSNPAVGIMEARQREAQVSAEIGQARKTGKNVEAAAADLRRGEQALASSHADQAMSHFDHAEGEVGIHASTTQMGSYSRPAFGSVAAGGVELSGAVVH